MRYTIPPLEIDETDSFKHDILNRKVYGEALLNIASNSTDELVISLDGKWGEGKSTFIKMWQGMLDENRVPNIYIDAFANDYIDDAFISIASAITNYAENNIKKSKKAELEKLKEKTKKVGGRLLSWSARIAIKAATLGIVNNAEIDSIESLKDDLANDTSDFIGDYIESRILSHAHDIEVINSFKDYLSTLPSKLQEEPNTKPLIIVIDELDRCRPTFAIEILEKTKHLFSVKNIVFVLVMNKSQMEESIRSIYGQNIDAHTYLQKFVHIETRLPKNNLPHHQSDHRRYIDRLIQHHQIPAWGDTTSLEDCLELLSKHLDLSLRQLEKAFTNLAILYGSLNKNSIRLPSIIAFLSIIKSYDTNLYIDLVNYRVTYDEFLERLNISPYKVSEEMKWALSWFQFSMLSEDEFSAARLDFNFEGYLNTLIGHNIHRLRLIQFYAKRLDLLA